MKKINRLMGHDYLFHHLIKLYLNNTLPNKIILNGKKGIGKFFVTLKVVFDMVFTVAILLVASSWLVGMIL